MVTGLFNEKIMEFLLQALSLTDLREGYDLYQLLAQANKIRDGRVKNVESKIPKFRSWEALGTKQVIDRVYGLDYICDVKPSNERIGFDFTTDPTRVEEKLAKAREFQPLWQALGVSKVIVLLGTYPQGDQGLAFYDTNDAIDNMLSVIFDAVESDRAVVQAEIMIQHEVN
jgi:hypothetical protein